MSKEDLVRLNNNQFNPDDEFFTRIETVREIYQKVGPYVKNKHIVMPFDNDDSNFVKYVKRNSKSNGWTYVNWPDDYLDFDKLKEYVKPNAVVISNPPFSIKREILTFFIKNNIKFILIVPRLWARIYRNICTLGFELNNCLFKRPDGPDANVRSCILTNFIDFNYRTLLEIGCNHERGSYVPWNRGQTYLDCWKNHYIKVSKASWPFMFADKMEYKEIRPEFGHFQFKIDKQKEIYKYLLEKYEKVKIVPDIKNSRRFNDSNIICLHNNNCKCK